MTGPGLQIPLMRARTPFSQFRTLDAGSSPPCAGYLTARNQFLPYLRGFKPAGLPHAARKGSHCEERPPGGPPCAPQGKRRGIECICRRSWTSVTPPEVLFINLLAYTPAERNRSAGRRHRLDNTNGATSTPSFRFAASRLAFSLASDSAQARYRLTKRYWRTAKAPRTANSESVEQRATDRQKRSRPVRRRRTGQSGAKTSRSSFTLFSVGFAGKHDFDWRPHHHPVSVVDVEPGGFQSSTHEDRTAVQQVWEVAVRPLKDFGSSGVFVGDDWMFGVRERLAVVRCGRAVGGPASCAAAPLLGHRGAKRGSRCATRCCSPVIPFRLRSHPAGSPFAC